ncbi:MAG: helix-turn-helix transcriptional regulator [Bacilli bacterium]|nr:helix-turn-helix transcriptional regulator [Bacilli bacterium]
MFNIKEDSKQAYWQYKYDDKVFNDIFYRHMHNNFEIHLIVKGEGAFNLDGKEVDTSNLDLIIVPPHSYHVFNVNKKIPYERFVFNFPQDYYGFDIGDVINKAGVHSLSTHHEIVDSFKKIDEYSKTLNEEDFVRMLHLYVQIILLQLKNTSFDDKESKSTNHLTASALSYIDEHLFSPLDVKTIADALYISKSHLQNTFYKSMKIGLKTYIIQRKIDKAQTMINEGMGATEVASMLGYRTYSTFYKSYTKIYGIPPNYAKKKKN